MRTLLFLCLAGLCAATPAPADDAPPAAPPEWFRAHLAYLTAGDGAWVTDNAAYRSADEPADAYEVTYVWGAGKQTAVGAMRAITGGKRSGVIWDYRVFWDPGARKAVIEQWGFHGVYGTGETSFVSGTQVRSEQTFFAPDGVGNRSAHDWIVDGPQQHTTRTFTFEDGAWQPGRTYVWKRIEAQKTND